LVKSFYAVEAEVGEEGEGWSGLEVVSDESDTSFSSSICYFARMSSSCFTSNSSSSTSDPKELLSEVSSEDEPGSTISSINSCFTSSSSSYSFSLSFFFSFF
jgi:hypothetical protein